LVASPEPGPSSFFASRDTGADAYAANQTSGKVARAWLHGCNLQPNTLRPHTVSLVSLYAGNQSGPVWSRVGSWASLALRLPNLRRPRRYREREAQDGRTDGAGRSGHISSHPSTAAGSTSRACRAATVAFYCLFETTTACAFFWRKAGGGGQATPAPHSTIICARPMVYIHYYY
jgi:hypothetical protein